MRWLANEEEADNEVSGGCCDGEHDGDVGAGGRLDDVGKARDGGNGVQSGSDRLFVRIDVSIE